MSEIQVGQINSTDGSTAITTSSGNTTVANNLTVTGGFVPSTQIGGRRNLIINGAMQVAQRGTSETGVTSMKYANAPDHYQLVINNMGAYTVSQSTDAPDGFANSYKIQCTTADASPAASDYFFFWTKHEGQDVQHLKFGTASAQQLTLSFWVKSNMTGTWQVNFRDKDNGRLITGTYTTNSADTWEYKTITVDGDTGSSGFNNDNNESFSLEFPLGAGTDFTSGTAPTAWEGSVNANRAASNTVNIASSTSNYWAITGVQLEVGTVATPFEHRSYGEELAACMRYCYVFGTGTTNNAALGTGFAYQTTWAFASIHFPVEMRSTPSLSNVGGSWEWSDWHVSGFATGTLSFGDGTRQGGKLFSAGTVSGLTDYRDYFLQRAGGSPTLTFDAEL